MLLCGAVPVQAKLISANAATLAAAWSAALPGDTIKLSGTFGLTRLQYKTSAKAITLDATKATFTDTLNINRVDGLNVVGGHFGSTTGPTQYGRAVVIYGGSNISFSKPVVVGNAGEQGIAFNDTVNASVWNGSFSNNRSAIGMTRVTNGALRGNKIYGAVSDGIDIAGSHNVTATYNTCSKGAPGPGVHPDCIQLWSIAGLPVQSDIMIAHNSATGPTQGFTSFDPAKGGGLRIWMLHNTVYTSYSQGIACYGCVDSNISYNSVRTIAGSAHMTNINIIGGSNNVVLGNTIGAFTRPAASPTLDEFSTTDLAPGDFSLARSEASSFEFSASESMAAVPEPSSWILLTAGFGMAGAAVRRSRRVVAA